MQIHVNTQTYVQDGVHYGTLVVNGKRMDGVITNVTCSFRPTQAHTFTCCAPLTVHASMNNVMAARRVCRQVRNELMPVLQAAVVKGAFTVLTMH